LKQGRYKRRQGAADGAEFQRVVDYLDEFARGYRVAADEELWMPDSAGRGKSLTKLLATHQAYRAHLK
tara:strand:- start:3086 stop:3289 length:204 start_codon:yes stop_codon:yes gene_type:complete